MLTPETGGTTFEGASHRKGDEGISCTGGEAELIEAAKFGVVESVEGTRKKV